MSNEELFNICVFRGEIIERGVVGNNAYIKILVNDIEKLNGNYMFIFENNKIDKVIKK